MSSIRATEIVHPIIQRLDQQDNTLKEILQQLQQQRAILDQLVANQQTQQPQHVHQDIKSPSKDLNHSWVIRSLIPLLSNTTLDLNSIKPLEERKTKKTNMARQGIDDETWLQARQLFTAISNDAQTIVLANYKKTEYQKSYGRLSPEQKLFLSTSLIESVKKNGIGLDRGVNNWLADYFIIQKQRGKTQKPAGKGDKPTVTDSDEPTAVDSGEPTVGNSDETRALPSTSRASSSLEIERYLQSDEEDSPNDDGNSNDNLDDQDSIFEPFSNLPLRTVSKRPATREPTSMMTSKRSRTGTVSKQVPFVELNEQPNPTQKRGPSNPTQKRGPSNPTQKRGPSGANTNSTDLPTGAPSSSRRSTRRR